MKIGFIGCGNMASAMISGMLKKGLYKKDEIIVSNLTEEGSKRSREKLGVVTTLDNHEVVKNTKLVFLAVKPQFYEEVLNEVKGELTPEHTVVGIAPGKTLAWLEEKCGQPLKVVRMMPNTPAQVGEGMTGVCANEKVSAEELAQICEITDSFGRTEVVPERLMDAVSAVSGCSPAYVFMFIEAMADAAVAQGMPRKQAYQFAAQALLLAVSPKYTIFSEGRLRMISRATVSPPTPESNTPIGASLSIFIDFYSPSLLIVSLFYHQSRACASQKDIFMSSFWSLFSSRLPDGAACGRCRCSRC